MIVAEAPSILDYLNEPSKAHFEAVTDMLDLLEIPMKLIVIWFAAWIIYTQIMSEAPKMGRNQLVCRIQWFS